MNETQIIDPKVIEWVALCIGTAGTILWSLGKNQLVVSLLWLFSAILWIAFAWKNGHYALTVRDILGIVLYAIGIQTYSRAKNKIEKEDPIKEFSLPLTIERTPHPDCGYCKGAGVHQLNGPETSISSCVKDKSTIVRREGH